MRALLAAVLLALACPLAACFDLDYGDVAFACGEGGLCPSGYECRVDSMCHRIGSPAGDRDAALPDPDGALAADGATTSADAANPPANDTCAAPALLEEALVATGTTVGANDDYELLASCLAGDGPDAVHQLSIADDSAVVISVEATAPAGWPVAVSLRDDGACAVADPDLSCVASSPGARLINRPNLAAGTYDLVVDGAGGASGEYEVRYDVGPADLTFGYWRIKTSGNTYAPLTGATALTPDDESLHPLSLPFSFPYFGASYSEVIVSSNGYLTFDSAAVPASEQFNNDCPLDQSAPDDLVAVFWEDLYPRDATAFALRYKSEGTAPNRTFSVEWVNFDIYESAPCEGPQQACNGLGAAVTHMAVLHENGDIEFHYGPRTSPTNPLQCEQQHLGCSATIGLRSLNGTFDADPSSCNTGDIAEGDVIYWVHPR